MSKTNERDGAKEEAFISFRKVWDDFFWLLPSVAIGRDKTEPLYRRYCIVISIWDRCFIVGWHNPKN